MIPNTIVALLLWQVDCARTVRLREERPSGAKRRKNATSEERGAGKERHVLSSHRHTEAGARAALQIIEAEDGMPDHVIRSTSTERAVVISPEMIKWTPILDGADVGILSGDPDLPGGEYAVRFRTSRDIRVPPHWHPEDEHVTVLQGSFSLGFGAVFEASLLNSLPPGSYVCVPRQTKHFALYGVGTVVQVNGIAPFKSIYVNPAEDLGDRIPRTT
jgi:hypothetical protein